MYIEYYDEIIAAVSKDPEKFYKWIQAEAEGRMIILPCKIGNITEEDLENLLQSYSSNRVLILPYVPGDVVYVLKDSLSSNRMYPAEVYLNSLADVIDLMFSRQQVYPTYAQAKHALDEMYKEV